MKIKNLFAALLCGMVIGILPAQAQKSEKEALKIIQRYEKATKISQLGNPSETLWIDMNLALGKEKIHVEVTIQQPDKSRVEMNMDSDSLWIVINGDSGCLMEKERRYTTISPDKMGFVNQILNPFCNLSWSENDYYFQIKDQKRENGKRFQGVAVFPREHTRETGIYKYVSRMMAIDHLVAYFDQQTGHLDHILVVFDISDPEADAGVDIRIQLSDYVKFGKTKVPTEIKFTVEEFISMRLIIQDVKIGVKIPKDYFELPDESEEWEEED